RPIRQPAKGMNAEGVAADTPLRLPGYLDLGDQVAGCRIRAREIDASCFTNQTASSVASDEILRSQRLAVGQRGVNAGVILGETGHLSPAIYRHPQLIDPAGEDALDVNLPEPEAVIVPGGNVADVQTDPGEASDLCHLPLREEPISDPALIENLDGA